MIKIAGNDAREGERGAISIKALLIFTLFAASLFVVIKIVPAYVEQRTVIHDIEELARIASVRNLSDEKIKVEIERVRTGNDLPDGSITLGARDKTVRVKIAYSRTINFLVTSYIWKVDEEVIGKSL
jgi:hypothetical protein